MGTSTSKETNEFMNINMIPPAYNSLEEYVQETISKLEADSLTRLRLDDFAYPDLAWEDEDFDGSTMARILVKAKEAPSLKELEFRFVDMNLELTTAVLDLLQTRVFAKVSLVGCTTPNELFVGLAKSLQHCECLILNHNHIPYTGYVALGKALANPLNKTTTSLHVKRETIGGESARELFQGLYKSHTMKELVLNFCRFHRQGVEALCECLHHNRSIQILDLGACFLPDEHVALLIRSLVGHRLKHLVLTLNSCHERGIATMQDLLAPKDITHCQLESLDLSHQKDEQRRLSLGPLAEALRTNKTLKELKLTRNRLGASDVEPLLQTLKLNSTLESLDLSNNVIGNEGVQRIAQAIRHFRGLKKLSLLRNEINSDQSALALAESMKWNRCIEVLEIKPALAHVTDIQFLTNLNWAGRKIVGSDKAVPLGLWPIILERGQTRPDFALDTLYYFLTDSNILRFQ